MVPLEAARPTAARRSVQRIEVYWAAGVGVMHAAVDWGSSPSGHLQGVEHGIGAHVVGDLPADDHSGVDIEDERHIQPSVPGRAIGDVGERNSFGAASVKSRSTRSGGRSAVLSAWVVNCRLPRCTPRILRSRISRATVQRAIVWPWRRRSQPIRVHRGGPARRGAGQGSAAEKLSTYRALMRDLGRD